MNISPKIDKEEVVGRLFPERDRFTATNAVTARIPCNLGPDCSLTCHFYGSAQDAPTVLFYPSADPLPTGYEEMALEYNRHGINIVLASYRSDGTTGATRSLSTYFEDGQAIFKCVSQWLEENRYSGGLFPMGQSMGSLLAIDVVVNNEELVKGLVLESAVAGTIPYLKARGVAVDILGIEEEDGFSNLQKIEAVKLPTLIFHGAADLITPVAEAEKLQATSGARTKQFFVIPGGGHNELSSAGGELYFQTIKKFLDTVCGVNTWRQRRRKTKKL